MQTRLEQKIEILKTHYDTQQIYNSMIEEIEQWEEFVFHDMIVTGEPEENVREIVDVYLEVLNDLAQYKTIVEMAERHSIVIESDDNLPESLRYMRPYWNKKFIPANYYK
jgi:chromatin segregation and condensation protein Rec8/ScpA/Scc1 (kleisin family)